MTKLAVGIFLAATMHFGYSAGVAHASSATGTTHNITAKPATSGIGMTTYNAGKNIFMI
ncbi:hypothetical protein [Sphaerisporangium rhizosphaerae]|uniref:Uncharacterized protein n=1 Tax=Sphaerisporangium rhizosphaerae TaxID=2269375 RepID=A0ABW2PB38_9ACTN